MSFHTELWILLEGGRAADVEGIRSHLTDYLDRNGLHHQVYNDLFTAFSSGNSILNLDGWSVRALLAEVSKQLPKLEFAARGVGEEIRDIWVREFAGGEQGFEAGPWSEG
ncbi:hypothetical protein BJP27_05535 [Pseudomonas oryzihabitans]|nr:hypothetical protein BJP27_05535 [Pseudomonas psychrotolerans]